MPQEKRDPESQLTGVDGFIYLQRARQYLLGYYGGARDDNDREAADRVLRPLESKILNDLGLSEEQVLQQPGTGKVPK